jgi:hypothetical protein
MRGNENSNLSTVYVAIFYKYINNILKKREIETTFTFKLALNKFSFLYNGGIL